MALLTPPSSSGRQYQVSFGSAEIDLSEIPVEIVNPSFEASSRQLIVGWRPVVWAGDAAFNITTSVSKSGRCAAFITTSSVSQVALVSNKIAVKPGGIYGANAWVIANVSKGNGGRISIAWFDHNDKYISTTSGLPISKASDWTKISVGGVAPEGAQSAEVELHLEGVGSVWYDDVSISQSILGYASQYWKVSREGLSGAKVTARDNFLELKGTFDSPFDERLTYTLPIHLDTNEYTLMSIKYRTSGTSGAGMLIVLNYVDGSKVVTYGTAFSNDWAVAYIDPRKTPAYIYYLGNRQIVPGKQLSSIEISLDDRPDTVSSGTYQLQISSLTFYRVVIQDFLLLGESALLLASLVIVGMLGLEPLRNRVPNVFSVVFGATLSFVAAAAIFLLPLPLSICSTSFDFYLILQLIGALIVLFGIITTMTVSDKRPLYGEKASKAALIGWIMGLFLIPSLGFLIRLNNAITLPMFDDELSYGITAWGLTHGSLVGLNLAAFSPEAQTLLTTGYFKVQPWPTNLPVPFTSTALYPDFTIVGPYFGHPFLGPLMIVPFISLFGFSAVGIRLPFILFSVGTSMLIFLIGARKGDVLAGLIGASFFNFTPYVAHYGSEAYLDNFLAFFFLLSVYFILEYFDSITMRKRAGLLYLSSISTAACTLFKFQGVFVSLFLLVAIYVSGCRRKAFLLSVLLYLTLASLYPITGLLISPQAFLLSQKGVFSIGLHYTSNEITGVFSSFDILRHWDALIALLCTIYLLVKNSPDKRILVWSAVSWVLYILLFPYKEWYFLSFFAGASLLLGYAFSDSLTNGRNSLWTVLLTLFLLILPFKKLGATLPQILCFLMPFALLVSLTVSNERNLNNSKQADRFLSYVVISYLITSFVLMLITAWSYKYWA